MFTINIPFYPIGLSIIFILPFTIDIFSQESENYKIGLNVFNILRYRKRGNYSDNKYFYPGQGTHATLFSKYKYDSLFFNLNLLLNSWLPLELTETGTIDENNSNFDLKL